MSPADVLAAAADLIEKCGRRRAWPEHGKHCPHTAIWRGRLLALNAHIATEALRAEVGPIIEWNDAEPDDAVVLATMRRVATQLRRAS